MAVNNANVRAHIDRALAAHATEPDYPKRLTLAFRMLQAERRAPGASLDEDLAAAEHHLFARQAVANNAVSLEQMLLMVVGYDAAKYALQRLGLGSLLQTTANPTAPASQASAEWGAAGAILGEADRKKYLPGSTPPPFDPSFMKTGSPLDKAYGSAKP